MQKAAAVELIVIMGIGGVFMLTHSHVAAQGRNGTIPYIRSRFRRRHVYLGRAQTEVNKEIPQSLYPFSRIGVCGL